MTVPKEYLAWAPAGSPWSPWVKPVLFSFLRGVMHTDAPWKEPEEGSALFKALREFPGGTALVVDRPDSMDYALFLASKGYRPIPLHNACPGHQALLDMWPAVHRLARGAEPLTALGLPDNAPPAFLLDSRRILGAVTPMPGKFDNRWMAMPQDFPSAAFLQSQGIDTVVLVMDKVPGEDILHVLHPWKKAGLRVLGTESWTAEPAELVLRMPSRLGHMAYRFLALMGLRRNSVGGFGALIPMPTSDGNGGGSWGGFS